MGNMWVVVKILPINSMSTSLKWDFASEIEVSNVPVFVVISFSVHEYIWYTKDHPRPQTQFKCGLWSSIITSLKGYSRYSIVSTPLSIIINQSLCSGIFQVNSKLIRWFFCFKRETVNYLEIIARFLYFSRKRHMAYFMNISHLIRFYMTVSTDIQISLNRICHAWINWQISQRNRRK